MPTSKVIIKQPKIVDKLLEADVLGYAYQKEFEIEIDPRQNSKEYLNTLIHEMLHCFLPNLSERSIIRLSNIITNEIWKRRYRRLDK
jgi:hypothetical protein